ncbi:aldehyde reductase [Dyadobacter sp. NIV53]|uniref:SDR family oxidoreductase n=1 Tax=Dyadobacter sp. NIV53 TaxID=2861765 RepID=UPI001C881B28|nr:aldehyde reductase [Dyadobacter sp. NIV53]
MKQTEKETVLVTGGSGYVGSYCILQLLRAGYNVKTTIRSMHKKGELLKKIRAAGAVNTENLTFFEADLNDDRGWADAVKNCVYVLHVASPFPASTPKDENELIIPARDGALRVLKAARNAGVKRVVLTSSFAAIGYSIDKTNHIFTETDWTDPLAPIAPYIRSKTVAELAAWDFVRSEGGDLELSVINPVGIFGPVLGHSYSASIELVKGIMKGDIKENSLFTFGVVDVRDVADIHITAMKHPGAAGERFLATSDGAMSFYDIAQIIKKQRSEIAVSVAEMIRTSPDLYVNLSNEKAGKVLNWFPRTKEEAILASVDSISELEKSKSTN